MGKTSITISRVLRQVYRSILKWNSTPPFYLHQWTNLYWVSNTSSNMPQSHSSWNSPVHMTYQLHNIVLKENTLQVNVEYLKTITMYVRELPRQWIAPGGMHQPMLYFHTHRDNQKLSREHLLQIALSSVWLLHRLSIWYGLLEIELSDSDAISHIILIIITHVHTCTCIYRCTIHV